VTWLREVLAWAAFAAIVGVLSVWPRYALVAPDDAIITVTFSHAAERVGECRRLSQAELDKLPPNMRRPSECPRERYPVYVVLKSDDRVLYEDLQPPSGIWSDGKANVYSRVVVPAGKHELFVGMRDSGRESGFDFEVERTIRIAPGQNVVIRFDQESRQFKFR